MCAVSQESHQSVTPALERCEVPDVVSQDRLLLRGLDERGDLGRKALETLEHLSFAADGRVLGSFRRQYHRPPVHRAAASVAHSEPVTGTKGEGEPTGRERGMLELRKGAEVLVPGVAWLAAVCLPRP